MKGEEEKEEDTWFATSDTSHNDEGPDWTQYLTWSQAIPCNEWKIYFTCLIFPKIFYSSTAGTAM